MGAVGGRLKDREVRSQHVRISFNLVKKDKKIDSYLIENKTNPVRLLPVRLGQGRGRVQLSLSL